MSIDLRKELNEEFDGWSPMFGDIGVDQHPAVIERTLKLIREWALECVGEKDKARADTEWERGFKCGFNQKLSEMETVIKESTK